VPYYIRVLGTDPKPISLEGLREAAPPATLEAEESDEEGWVQLTLSHKSGVEIAIIERNPVVEGELGAEEIQEFIEEVSEYKPDSAAAWLRSYLATVKVIYAFQLLDGTDLEDGWTILHRVYGEIKSHAGGITQADGEGFSNEAGYTILWQFNDTATGSWSASVLNSEGNWVDFQMDLGDQAQREAFWRGEVPAGARLW